MKTKVTVSHEFVVTHENEAQLKKARAALKERPVFESSYSAGFSIKRLKTKGAIQS